MAEIPNAITAAAQNLRNKFSSLDKRGKIITVVVAVAVLALLLKACG